MEAWARRSGEGEGEETLTQSKKKKWMKASNTHTQACRGQEVLFCTRS